MIDADKVLQELLDELNEENWKEMADKALSWAGQIEREGRRWEGLRLFGRCWEEAANR